MINKSREAVEIITRDLEDLIDSNSLSGILGLIATIAHEKADHERVNWGDRVSAKLWTRVARQIEKIASDTDL